METRSYVQTDQPGYLKDEKTGLIVNINDNEYQSILVKRAAKKKQNELEQRMDSIESQVAEILQILRGNKG